MSLVSLLERLPDLNLSEEAKAFIGKGKLGTIRHIIVSSPLSLHTSSNPPMTIEEVKAVREAVLDMNAAPAQSAFYLFTSVAYDGAIFGTGFQPFDDLTGGGILNGEIAELVGPTSCGKTQLCHMFACHAVRPGGHLVYFDTSVSFSPKRLTQIIKRMHANEPVEIVNENIETYLSRIRCVPASSLRSLLAGLEALRDEMSEKKTLDGRGTRAIVIDCISSVIAPVLGGRNFLGHSLMCELMRTLYSIAHDYQVAVLMTSHTVSGDRPSLGETWTYMATSRMQMEPYGDVYKMVLTKSGRTVSVVFIVSFVCVRFHLIDIYTCPFFVTAVCLIHLLLPFPPSPPPPPPRRSLLLCFQRPLRCTLFSHTHSFSPFPSNRK